MPVMKQLRIGSETYDTVGEASVTQVQTSGTKIATVTIDGTATDLYAPEGGSSIDPATTAPLMDGTAAAGTSTSYARADHVHPTDTSRAAASHTHAIADVTNLQTALDGKQPTLVSGTSIKTINGESILGSGNIATPTYTLPEATTSTLGGVKVDGTTITANDGVISAVGGGSVSMEDTAVDAAVEAAWPVSHTIDGYSYCRSITLDGSYGADVTVLETEAMPNDVVTFSHAAGMTLIVTDASDEEVPSTYVDTYMTGGGGGFPPAPATTNYVYSFVMPNSNVTINAQL